MIPLKFKGKDSNNTVSTNVVNDVSGNKMVFLRADGESVRAMTKNQNAHHRP